MTFDEACAVCPPGYMFKSITSGWSEYSTQYGRDSTGNLYWTAGGTVGGNLTDDMIKRERKVQSTYAIYKTLGSSYPVDKIPSFEEAYDEIKKQSLEYQALPLFKRLKDTVTEQAQIHAERYKLEVTVTEAIGLDVTKKIIEVLDTRDQYKNPIFNLVKTRGVYPPNLLPELNRLFNEINS